MDGDAQIRAVIVDDEAPARSILLEYLAGHPDFTVVAECSNGFEAVKTIQTAAVDVVFLDIQMPKLDGFEVLELLDSPPLVVFVTAYDEYAVRAFEVRAVDYLLKPFPPDRFAEVLERVRDRLGRQEAGPRITSASAARSGGRRIRRIVVRQGADIEVIPTDAIDYIEAQDDSVVIATKGRKVPKASTLQELEECLDPDRFLRVHRSFLLNIDRLAKLELYAKDSRIAILRDGARIPVSRAGYSRLRERM